MSYADNVLVQGQVADAAANAGNPVKTGAVYNSSAPSFSTGQVADSQADINGNLKVSVVNGISGGTAGTPSTTVLSIQGEGTMTPVQTQSALGGSVLYATFIAPATVAVQTIQASAGQVLWIHAGNILATPVYLKFYDQSSAPTLGTTAASFQIMIPGNTAGASVQESMPGGIAFQHKIYCAVSSGISLTDNTATTANSVVVSIGYSP